MFIENSYHRCQWGELVFPQIVAIYALSDSPLLYSTIFANIGADQLFLLSLDTLTYHYTDFPRTPLSKNPPCRHFSSYRIHFGHKHSSAKSTAKKSFWFHRFCWIERSKLVIARYIHKSFSSAMVDRMFWMVGEKSFLGFIKCLIDKNRKIVNKAKLRMMIKRDAIHKPKAENTSNRNNVVRCSSINENTHYRIV